MRLLSAADEAMGADLLLVFRFAPPVYHPLPCSRGELLRTRSLFSFTLQSALYFLLQIPPLTPESWWRLSAPLSSSSPQLPVNLHQQRKGDEKGFSRWWPRPRVQTMEELQKTELLLLETLEGGTTGATVPFQKEVLVI